MSATILTTSVRCRGSGKPTHTATAGVVYLDTSTGILWSQQTAPTGSLWVPQDHTGGLEIFTEVENVIEIAGNLEIFTEV